LVLFPRLNRCGCDFANVLVIATAVATLVLWTVPDRGFPAFDPVSNLLESPQFKGKDPIDKLRLVADMIRSNKVKHSEISFLVLDWADQFLREPPDPLERLKRWASLTNDDKLTRLRIPRDFLNRTLLAEYLVGKTPYLKSGPRQRLEIVSKLEAQNLADWSVALDYARLYAGSIIAGAKGQQNLAPMEALGILKILKDDGIVGWHYRVPTEALLVAEALAVDKDFQKASPLDQLIKLRGLEQKGLITALTKKELERLPAWRLLTSDATFLKGDQAQKDERLVKLKDDGLITESTSAELKTVFRPISPTPDDESRPLPPVRKTPTPRN